MLQLTWECHQRKRRKPKEIKEGTFLISAEFNDALLLENAGKGNFARRGTFKPSLKTCDEI